jgi:hypothetical protein
MTIYVYSDRIVFPNYTLSVLADNIGLRLDGEITATDIIDPFQGMVAGYTSGGYNGPPASNVIDKFPFATDISATDVGDLSQTRKNVTGQSGPASGYTSGGFNSGISGGPLNTIDKFPFSSDANATDVGDLSNDRYNAAGQSSSVNGYTSGGNTGFYAGYRNVIDKFPFAANTNATDVGDLTASRQNLAGQSSSVSGYTSGGATGGISNVIDKFPFSSDANATDVGDLPLPRRGVTGQSSTTSGYSSGGSSPDAPVSSSPIEKFPFSTDSNATNIGSLTISGGYACAGQSSNVSGYSSGRVVFNPTTVYYNVIDKFPFAVDSSASDVGDLTSTRSFSAGQQD